MESVPKFIRQRFRSDIFDLAIKALPCLFAKRIMYFSITALKRLGYLRNGSRHRSVNFPPFAITGPQDFAAIVNLGLNFSVFSDFVRIATSFKSLSSKNFLLSVFFRQNDVIVRQPLYREIYKKTADKNSRAYSPYQGRALPAEP